MQIIKKKKYEKLFCNIYEKLNSYQMYVFLPLPVKMGHWFYISKKMIIKIKKKKNGKHFNIFVFFVFFIKVSCQKKESPLSRKKYFIPTFTGKFEEVNTPFVKERCFELYYFLIKLKSIISRWRNLIFTSCKVIWW